jgi:hypothetical protein
MNNYPQNPKQIEIIDAIVRRGIDSITKKFDSSDVDSHALMTQVFFCICLDIKDKLPEKLQPIATVLGFTIPQQQIDDATEGLTLVAQHSMELGIPREHTINHIYMMFINVYFKYFPNSKIMKLG